MSRSGANSATFHAALFAMGGMTLLGFIDNFVPQVARDIGVWQFHAVRSAMVLLGLCVLASAFGWRMRPNRIWAVGLRSFFTSTAMILYFGAVASMPIAEVAAGLFTSPIWVLLLGWGFLGHRIGPVRIVAVAIGFLGVLLILRPDAASTSLFSLIPLIAGLFWALGAIATRTICAGESASALLIGFFLALGLWGVIGLGYFALSGIETDPIKDGFFGTGWQAFTSLAVAILVGQAVISGAGVALLTKAYQLAEASHVTVFEYFFLISAGFWAYVLYGQIPDPLALLGIALIAVAGALIVLRSAPHAAAQA